MLLFFTVVGIYAVACYLYDNLRTPLCLLHRKWQQRNGKQQNLLIQNNGKWAAVTGATDGIGKSYAKDLARLGFNIVLIARTKSKLKQVAQEIVNNVGIGHNPPGTISTFSIQHIWDVINVNMGAATLLSRFFIEKWHKNGVRGHIVNVSSGLGWQPCPFGSIYGASKAYMHSLTLALQEETKHLGITVQLLMPNFVVTKINSYSKFVMKGNIFIPQADEYAKSAIKSLGIVDESTGYFWHGIQTAILKLLPCRLRVYLLNKSLPLIVDNLNDVGASY